MQFDRTQPRRLHARKPRLRRPGISAQIRSHCVREQGLPDLSRADDAEALGGVDELETGREACFKDARDEFARVRDFGAGFEEGHEGVVGVAADEEGVVGVQEGEQVREAVGC